MTGPLAVAEPAPPAGPVRPIGGEPGVPRVRMNHSFSADGRYAACLALDPASGALVVESWTFIGGRARAVRLPVGEPETVGSQLVPLGPGRVLVARQRPGAHELALLSEVDGVVRQRRLASPVSPEFRLLPPAGPAAPVIAAGTGADGSTTLSRVEPRTGRLVPLTRVGWPLRSGGWLDPAGRLLATNRADDGRVVVLDLAAGTVHRLPAPGGQLLLASPASGLLLLCRPDGPARLVYAGPDGTPRHQAAALDAVDGAVLPLAFDPAGRRVALRVRRGARCRLLVHDAGTDSLSELAVPAGTIGAAGAWGTAGLRFPYGSPTCPSGLAMLSSTALARWQLAGCATAGGYPARDPASWDPDREPAGEGPAAGAGDTPVGDAAGGWGSGRGSGGRGGAAGGGPGSGWIPAAVEVFPAGDGLIEAVVYGDWRTAADLAVLLHGGPDSAWELDFQPLLQAIAGAGIAVVAPNPRGSSGYGPAFADAIRGRWGGPDLADVLWLAEALVAGRPPGAARPAVFGGSYGAFLALLAASTAPGLWSRCVATAPFLSTRRLYRQATPAVRALLDRLGGRGPAGTDPDLLDLCPRIRVPLLLIHGECDDVVPVAQSRALRGRLRAAGRVEGSDFGYVEVPGAGHFALLPDAEPAPPPARPDELALLDQPGQRARPDEPAPLDQPATPGQLARPTEPRPQDVPTPLEAAVVRFLRTGDLTPFRCRPRRGNAPSSPERR
ncbi:MAG TPA: alpha/beta fold hydrolase [Mycobacteriales bacterium]|nr:alpha/beta fold hydrolase [Mycobacteriales bacterium]